MLPFLVQQAVAIIAIGDVKKIDAPTRYSWFEYCIEAEKQGGRLPYCAELVDSPCTDVADAWVPVQRQDGHGDWCQVGTHPDAKQYTTVIDNWRYAPGWGAVRPESGQDLYRPEYYCIVPVANIAKVSISPNVTWYDAADAAEIRGGRLATIDDIQEASLQSCGNLASWVPVSRKDGTFNDYVQLGYADRHQSFIDVFGHSAVLDASRKASYIYVIRVGDPQTIAVDPWDTWEARRRKAEDNFGRLPTMEELRSAGCTLTGDIGQPVKCPNLNERDCWVQIGDEPRGEKYKPYLDRTELVAWSQNESEWHPPVIFFVQVFGIVKMNTTSVATWEEREKQASVFDRRLATLEDIVGAGLGYASGNEWVAVSRLDKLRGDYVQLGIDHGNARYTSHVDKYGVPGWGAAAIDFPWRPPYMYVITGCMHQINHEEWRSYSSTNGGPTNSTLDAVEQWQPKHNVTNEFVQIHMLRSTIVHAAVVQGCEGVDSWKHVKKYQVEVSHDKIRWESLPGEFSGGEWRYSLISHFSEPKRAHHVRVIVKEWQEGICMRVAMVACPGICRRFNSWNGQNCEDNCHRKTTERECRRMATPRCVWKNDYCVIHEPATSIIADEDEAEEGENVVVETDEPQSVHFF